MKRRSSYDTHAQGPTSILTSFEIGRPAGAPDRQVAPVQEGRLELPSGRSIECTDALAGGELVTIRGPAGAIELEVRLTERGPVLSFAAAELELRAAGRIRAECETFEVAATGDIRQRAGGALTSRGREAEITATRGDVRIRANDDVRINGERVKLNC